MVFQEIDNEESKILKKVIDFDIPGKNYVLKYDDKTIGYSRVNIANEDNIFIYILEEYRGNGYGKELFKLTLEKLEKEEIVLNISKQNIQMQKIINGYKNIEIKNTPKYITYVINTKK